ncbi:hypothetical protein C8R45DRAFT_1073150 [Mycena sanguinolenta]|nr:hypothetical protein C8R45DRAFT_1073150 [Mycena sanguinolenta]
MALFDADDLSSTNHSTGLPRYSPAPLHSTFPAGFVSPWQLHSPSSLLSPNAIGPTAGPMDHSSAFSPLQMKPQPQYVDASRREGTWISSVDALANGVDAVSDAFLQFLQLVESEGRSRLNRSAPYLLRILLSNGCLAPNDLLAVVDWDRLRNLAEKSVSRAFTPLALESSPWGHLPLDALQTSPISNATSDFGETGDSDRGLDLLPQEDATILATPSTGSSDLTIPQSQPLFQPSEQQVELCSPATHWPVTPQNGATVNAAGGTKCQCLNCGVDQTTQWKTHSESSHLVCNACAKHQPVAPNAGTIINAGGTKRQCLNCGVNQTTQWRRHPKSPGFLCNACGQHQLKHRAPRSKEVIMRGRAKANHKHGTVPIRRSSLPEKRGGDVIMRISSKLAEHC